MIEVLLGIIIVQLILVWCSGVVRGRELRRDMARGMQTLEMGSRMAAAEQAREIQKQLQQVKARVEFVANKVSEGRLAELDEQERVPTPEKSTLYNII